MTLTHFARGVSIELPANQLLPAFGKAPVTDVQRRGPLSMKQLSLGAIPATGSNGLRPFDPIQV